MPDVNKTIPFHGVWYRIAFAIAVCAFFVCLFTRSGTCVQDLREPKDCESLFVAAVKAEQQHDTVEAELRYEECRETAKKLQLTKVEAAASHRLAVIKARSRKFTESLKLFERAIALDPENAHILCDFAQLYVDRKDYNHAETILKNAVNLDPDNPKVLFKLGEVIASQRSDPDRQREAEGLRYMKLAVGEAEAYRELARIYRSKGDIERAEFAEQKAKTAKGQQTTLAGGPGSSLTRLPQRAQTPPEIMSRVREELVDLENRETEAQQRQDVEQLSVRSPVMQPPFIPTPTRQTTPQPQSSVAIPADPFAITPRPEPPPAVPPATSPVRIIPNSEPQKVIRQSEQSNVLDPFTFVPVAENKQPANNNPSFVRIISPEKGNISTKVPMPQRSPVPSEKKENPATRTSPSGDDRNERRITSQTEPGKMINPLRQVPAGGAGLIDPAADVSVIASMPSYSAVGAKRIPRVDQDVVLEQSKNTLTTVESKSDGIVARNLVSLPVRETEVLKSSSAVVARRETLESSTLVPEKGTDVLGNLRSHQDSRSNPEYAGIVQSGRGFIMAHAPDMIQFSPVRNTPSTAYPPEQLETKKIVATTSKPLSQSAVPPNSTSLVRLPQVAGRDSDYPKMIVNVSPTIPAATPAAPSPILAADNQQLPSLTQPLMTQSPQFTQPSPVVQPLPIIQQPLVAQSPSAVQSLPDIQPPQFTQPQPLAQSPVQIPHGVIIAPPDPFAMAVADQPQTSPATSPRGMATAPAPVHPFPVVDNPLIISEAKKQEPLPNVSHLPMETPRVAEARMPIYANPPHVQEEPTGFASTRKAGQPRGEEPTGFARSRR